MSTSTASTTPTRSSGARIADVVATVVLLLAAAVMAVLLFWAGLLWAMAPDPNAVAFGLGVYGPIVITVIAVIAAIILIVRNRLAFWVPLAAIVLSVCAWWLGALLV